MASAGANLPQSTSTCDQIHQCTDLSKCELSSLTASQIGSVVGLSLGLLIFAYQMVSKQHDPNERYLTVEYFAIFVMSSLYYFLEEWIQEEHKFLKFRTVKWPRAEFFIRVLNVVVIGFAAVLPSVWADRMQWDPIDAGLFFMAFLYDSFLVWDWVVTEAGEKNIDDVPFFGDFAGGMLTIAVWWGHRNSPTATAVATILLVATVSYQLGNSRVYSFLKLRMERARLR